MKRRTNYTTIKKTLPIIICQFFILAFSINVNSQENPWQTEKSGTNPWSGEVIVAELPDSSVNTLPLKEISSQELTYARELELVEFGNREYKATGAAVFSGLTSTFFSFFAIPFNLLLTAVIPTPQAKNLIDDYKRQNPNATKREIKKIKKGIAKKRSGNSLKGSAVGCGINLVAILILILL